MPQRADTTRSTARSLRLIVKTVHESNPDEKLTSVLTANLIREFEKRQTHVDSSSRRC